MVLQQYVSLSFLQTGSNQQLSYASRDVPVIKTMLLAQCSLCSSINQFKPAISERRREETAVRTSSFLITTA